MASVAGALGYLDEEVAALRRQGLYQWPPVLEGEQGPVAVVDGRRVINLSSTDYLGLAGHPRLREAAARAIQEWGVAAGGSRALGGGLRLHEELEGRLAAFMGAEAVLLCPSGWAAATAVGAILGPGDVVVHDRLSQGAVACGCGLSGASRRAYEHGDVDDARRLLEEARRTGARRVVLATDGVFATEGDLAPLPQLVEAAQEHDAIVVVGEGDALGVVGQGGRGAVDHYHLQGRVHVRVGTLGRALAAAGGYVAGSRALVEYLVSRSRPVLHGGSPPPPAVAAAVAALELLERDPSVIERLWENADTLAQGLRRLGFDTGPSVTPIVPVAVGEERRAVEASRRLFAEGVFAAALVHPAVPPGAARVRAIATAAHTREQLGRALEAFARVGRQLEWI